MAKLQGPLLSEQARGSMGPRLTFSERKSGSQVRYQGPQKDRITPARIIQRGFFQVAVSWWHQLSTDEQYEWHKYGLEDC